GVTSQGSIFVNGIEYDTSTATITINGQPGTEADLLVGMYVDVIGTDDGVIGIATSVTYNSDMNGAVTAVFNPVDGTLEIMGKLSLFYPRQPSRVRFPALTFQKTFF
ncbi:MAG: hypothetical protein JKY67_08710, partial [Pseudomonadales bacterium]|nr:hypothetical protein [Pseudomonadales bacterium]